MSEKRSVGRPRKNQVVIDVEERLKMSEMEQQLLYGIVYREIIHPANLRVFIFPFFRGEDKGDGGIRRVYEAQEKWLPKFGVDLVNTPEEADIICFHATGDEKLFRMFPEKPFVEISAGQYWQEVSNWGNWELKANADVMENIRLADSVVTCSEWVANGIRRHSSRPVTVIPHGINMSEWEHNLEPKDYVLWNKTRPDPVCSPEPMNMVAALLPQVKFVSTFGQETPNVVLTGKFSFEDAKKVIKQAGVYLATVRETFGIGTLEALASGCPVVGYNWGGTADIVTHLQDGYLAAPGDVEDLARGIIWALQNRAQISPKARHKALQYSWEKIIEQYAVLFRQVHQKKQEARPKVSIIVTNYNLEKYLPMCLYSVESQTDKDWECIVVDDASTNLEGLNYVEELVKLDDRFKLVVNEKNVYLAEARNVGIRMARGRYILPLDADDMLAPNAVELLSAALDTDRSIHIAYGNVRFVEEDGTTLTNYGREFPLGHSSWPFQFSFEQQIQQRNLLPYCSMFRREVWENTGGYRRRCRTAEDADMWTRVSSYGYRPKMVSSEDTLIYRNRPDSMSREQGESEWIRWFVWHKFPEFTPAGAVTKQQLPVPSLDPIVISVIIPVGPGHEKLVTDAVDSVDCQTFRNWECIVINDTGKPLATELPAWVKVLETEGKTGPAHARNVGIAASKGRLFLPLDADDYLEPDALQFMWEAHQIDKEVIYSDFWQTDMSGKNISIHQCDDYDPHLLTGRKRTFNNQVREGMIHSVTALTPKSAWEKIGGYDESLPAWEDWDFQLALGNIGACSRRVAMPLFFYRKHTGFRREENYAFFEKSKEAIVKKWGHLWSGGQELMACGSCGSRRTVTPTANRSMMTPQKPNGDAVLLKYEGSKQGAIPMRGASRTMYFFAKDDVKYVLTQDAEDFISKYPNDFSIVRPANEEPLMTSPILVAAGPPQG